MRKGIGGILLSLILITSIAAVMPMAAGNGVFSISGYKYDDATGEGLENWTITASYFVGGYFIKNMTTTTDQNGYWEFTDIDPGTYVVTEELQPGWVQKWPLNGSYKFYLDGDYKPPAGGLIFRNSKKIVSSNNASIGDYVWEDLNANGIQDADETGISDVTVNLYHHSVPSLVATMKTNETGYYHFTNLPPGNYSLEFILPDGYGFSPPDQGDDDALDTDSNTCSGKTAVTTLEPTEDDLTWDSGMYKTELYCISGYKRNVTGTGLPNWTIFIDANGNGQLDNEECRATTTGADGSITGDDGYWAICGLVPGDYTVCEVLKSGWIQIDPIGCHEVTITNEDLTNVNFINRLTTNPGTGTPGYWKNHPDAWPVNTITIGGVTYSKEEAIEIMGMPDGDKTYTMFRALVAAKLNVLIGNDDSCIADTITYADAWMAEYGPAGSGSCVHADDYAWQEGGGEDLYETLDDYNNGELCAPSRDVVESGMDTDTTESDYTAETTTTPEETVNGKNKKEPKK